MPIPYKRTKLFRTSIESRSSKIEVMRPVIKGLGDVMAKLTYANKNATRNRPLTSSLEAIVTEAADMALVDEVVVISGGQPRLGTPGKRVGSTRHDDGKAGDVRLKIGGRTLDFEVGADRAVFEQFFAAAVALGATGIGAGVGYMGRNTVHVGFGGEAVWGAGGRIANAPAWLKKAFDAGKRQRLTGNVPSGTVGPDTAKGDYKVIARSGLHLRALPGTEHPSRQVLPSGTRLFAKIDVNSKWAQVDLQGDGHADGYVFADYIAPV